MQQSFLSDLHMLTHLIFLVPPWGNYYSFLKIREMRSIDMNDLAKVI